MGHALIRAMAVFAAIAAVSSPAPSLAAELRGSSPFSGDPGIVVRVDTERGLVTTRTSQAPLREVFETLERHVGLRFRLADPRLGDHVVTYDLREEPPERLLGVLLRGFSYVVRHDGSEQLVTIVAGPPPTAAFRNLAVSTPSPALVRPGSTTDVAVTARREAGRPGLDAHVRRVHEAQLLRSLVALDTRAAEDRQYHLETLVGQDDPGATETLVRDAVFEPSPIPEARRAAVRRLWRHAAARGFVEDTSVAALGQVAEDGDEQVAEVAREALEDLRRYHGASLCDRSRSFAAICPSWASER
jgi:hypothetical protein